MSLNDHLEPTQFGVFTLEDLGLATTDQVKDDVLSVAPDNAPVAVITTDIATPGPHPTSMNQSEIEEMPNWASKIRILKENATKIVDMRDVQKDIENGARISQGGGDVIEATFESFYSHTNPRVTYTPFESKTNLAYASSFMTGKIKASMEALITEFRSVVTDSEDEVTKDLLKTREYCVHELRDEINRAVTDIEAACAKLCLGPVILPFDNGEFMDMTKINFIDVNLETVKTGVPISDEFRKAYRDMVDLWKGSNKLRTFVAGLLDIYKAENANSVLPTVYDGLYCATILTAFGKWTSDSVYDGYVSELDNSQVELNERRELLKTEVETNPENADVVISTSGARLATLAEEMSGMEAEAKNLGDFIKACSVVVTNLSKLR